MNNFPEFSKELVGMDLDEARAKAQGQGWILRVSRLDGKPRGVTMDYRTDRMDVAVDGSKVTSLLRVG